MCLKNLQNKQLYSLQSLTKLGIWMRFIVCDACNCCMINIVDDETLQCPYKEAPTISLWAVLCVDCATFTFSMYCNNCCAWRWRFYHVILRQWHWLSHSNDHCSLQKPIEQIIFILILSDVSISQTCLFLLVCCSNKSLVICIFWRNQEIALSFQRFCAIFETMLNTHFWIYFRKIYYFKSMQNKIGIQLVEPLLWWRVWLSVKRDLWNR